MRFTGRGRNRWIVGLGLVAVLAAGLATVGCSKPGDHETSDAPTSAGESAETTIGPLGLNETAIVGPYEVQMFKVRFAGNRVSVHVLVRNPNAPAAGEDRTVPVPGHETFRVVDELGVRQDGLAVTFFRGIPDARDPRNANNPGLVDNRIRPGGFVTFGPQFGVKPGTKHLTLLFSPVRDRPNLVVSFRVR